MAERSVGARATPEPSGSRRRALLTGAAAGLVALLVFLGVAELVAIATGPDSAPSIAIGQAAINHSPEWLKQFAIRHFGEHDKTVLLAGIYTTLALLAAIVGAVSAVTRRAVGLVAIALLGIVAAISAATRPTAGQLAIAPSLIGAVAAMYAFGWIAPASSGRTNTDGGEGLTRRRALQVGGILAVAGAAGYAVGRRALQGSLDAVSSRNKVKLPPAIRTAPPTAGDTGFDVAGLSSYITPNRTFYRVDTALVVPELQTKDYRLQLHGMVKNPVTFTYDDIIAMAMIEHDVTLTCVSDPVGGTYIGNASWQGALLKPILERAGVSPDADQLFMTSVDGMTIGGDLLAAMDGRAAMLAVGMNGEPLPFEHGFPVRAVIPGIYGYASACKWLVDMEVTTYEARQAYWVRNGYSAQAPIKVESRIDTPSAGQTLEAGQVAVAGVAWRQHVGISKVEVSVDGGDWAQATLAAVQSADTWRLWRWDWQATQGRHTLKVRATDAEGNVQTARRQGVIPNGATGQEAIEVMVT